MEEYGISFNEFSSAHYSHVNDKEITKILEKNWRHFITYGTASNPMRKEILRSWLRCRENFVDPYRGYNNKILSHDELKDCYHNVQEMINVAKPVMRSLYNSIKGSGYMITINHKDGIIMELLGDMSIRRLAESLDVVPGASCDENIVGTTAPGISLKEGIPARVDCKEHYCEIFHYLSCSAAPIFNPQGRLLGCLVLSSTYDKAHPHTLGLVMAAAKSIEGEICYRALHNKLKKTYHYIDTISNSMSEGMISINSQGEIMHINRQCADMLGTSIYECKGAPISKVINNAETLTGLLAKNQKINDKELTLVTKKGRTRVNTNITVLEDESEDTVNYLVTFKEIEKMQSTANKKAGLTASYTFDDLKFVSKKMQNVIACAQKISETDSTVLIEGESGTGKEILAHAIHNYSSRCKKPFVAVNCSALPKELIQSELFGYVEGAFTGAKKGGKAGKFEMANGGTIFLDEIGDMSLEAQANMLRVLQEKQLMRIGGNHNIELDIRVIAATNKQLKSEIEKGTFRPDLFYRLNILPIQVPPLRERREDILPLARYFIKRQCLSLGRPQVFLSPEVEEIFLSYDWPGNIRELKNIITRIIVILEGDKITLDTLPNELLMEKSAKTAPVVSLEELERKAIIDALSYYNNNIFKSAKGLGITRATLYKKIKKFNIR
jgi:transcriptional regulator of acetoin/glycerol metabolism